MLGIQVFNSDRFGDIRASKDERGDVWFIAKDVCNALGLEQVSRAISRLDDDEKGVTSSNTPGGIQKLVSVNESGLYSLVLSSRKPEAKAFKRWVTHEVIPSIRKDGGYMVAREEETPEQVIARALILANKTLERQRERIEELTPKAMFADAVAASDGTCLIGEVAKMLRQNGIDMGQNRLFALLRDDGLLGKSGSNRNVPTQRAMEMGLFRIKETAVTHSDGHVTLSRTPKVTGKGQRYMLDRYGAA